MTEMKGHRWFAATYDLLNRGVERRVFGPLRLWVVGEATGNVLEIGAGTGASFPYYQHVQQLTVVEPDPHMLARAERRAAVLGLDAELRQAPAEELPFPDQTFDAVVCTLVLCSVGDPRRVLAEVRRTLKPRGTLRFIEHVRADGRLGRIQDFIAPCWQRLAAGCHLNRRTMQTIQESGFRLDRIERVNLRVGIPLFAGIARPLPLSNGPAGV